MHTPVLVFSKPHNKQRSVSAKLWALRTAATGCFISLFVLLLQLAANTHSSSSSSTSTALLHTPPTINPVQQQERQRQMLQTQDKVFRCLADSLQHPTQPATYDAHRQSADVAR